jgi:hypothetical membrane protein
MQESAHIARQSRMTNWLVAGGAVAGPLFTLAWLLGEIGRPGYDPLRHPISSLSIGELGWTQTVSFLITGLLTLAFAFGLRRLLSPPGGSIWGPRLIALIGVGLLGAGVFVTDPLNGYPPGTVALPLNYTLPGRLHRLFSSFVFLGLPIACVVFARHFARWDERSWAVYSLATAVAFVMLFVVTSMGFGQVARLADYAGLLQRITLTVGWAWLTLLAARMLRFRQGDHGPGKGST